MKRTRIVKDDPDDGEDFALKQSLKLAVEGGRLDEVMAVLNEGVDIDCYCDVDKGRTALLIAVTNNDIPISCALLKRRANFMLPTIRPNKVSKTALHIAAKKGFLEIVRALLDAGCPVDIEGRFKDGRWTPLCRAVLFGPLEMLELLVDRGANINLRLDDGLAPLELAAFNGITKAVRFLVQKGANVNSKDHTGSTPLASASLVGALSAVKILVEDGKADTQIPCEDGDTPIDLAVRYGMFDVAYYLWQKGSQPKVCRDSNGLGPARWLRPRVLGGPSPRVMFGCTNIGSKIYLLGGSGRKQGVICTNPDNSSFDTVELSDFWELDIDEAHLAPLCSPTDLKNYKDNKLTTERIGPFITVGEDQLSFESSVPHEESIDTCVYALHPFKKELKFAYFEVSILKRGETNVFGVGLTSNTNKLDEIPGWARNSFGYHGDDGLTFQNTASGSMWARRYGEGDVIGCGINFETEEVFFTLNGIFLGVAFTGLKKDLYYACAGLSSYGHVARFNFGATPFVFDLMAPTLVWKRLPSPVDSELVELPPQFLQEHHGKLILVSSISHHKGYFEVFDPVSHTWTRSTTDVQKWYSIADNFAYLNNAIYLFNAQDNREPFIHKLTLDENCNGTWSVVSWDTPGSLVSSPQAEKQCRQKLKSKFNDMCCLPAKNTILFITNDSILELDPETLSLTTKPLQSPYPCISDFSATYIGEDIQLFGGQDDHSKRNEVFILQPSTQNIYAPHIKAGVCPRPRSIHHTITIQPSPHNCLLESSEAQEDADSDISQLPFTVSMLGVGDVNLLRDFEILSWERPLPHPYLQFIIASPAEEQFGRVTFKIIPIPNQSPLYLSTLSIIVISRASKLRELILSGTRTVEITGVPFSIFKLFLEFLHDDNVTFPLEDQDARLLHQTFEKWAPEHAERIAEALIMTVLDKKSRMSEDMAFAFDNPFDSDIDLVVDGLKTIKAHKCILSTNSKYFKSLFSSGLQESSLSTIHISENSPLALMLLLKYIYTQNMDLSQNAEHIIDILVLSNKYGLTKLQKQVEKTVGLNLTDENVISLTILSIASNANILEENCLEYITKHMEELKTTPEYLENKAILESRLEAHPKKIQASYSLQEVHVPKHDSESEDDFDYYCSDEDLLEEIEEDEELEFDEGDLEFDEGEGDLELED